MSTDNIRVTFFTPGPLNLINSDHRAAKVLDAIPEFRAIRDSYANITRETDVPPQYDNHEAAQRLREGADLGELAREAAAAHRLREDFSSAAASIRGTAQGAHDTAVRSFLRSHRKQLAAGVLREFNAIKQAAKEPLKILGDGLTQEQILDDPETWAAWKKFKDLAEGFDAWRRTQSIVTERGYEHSFKKEWLYFDVIADYDKAWPNFQRTETEIKHLSESTRITVHSERAPWTDTASLLRDAVRRDLKFWSPTGEDLSAEVQRLKVLAEKRQDADMRAAMENGSYAARR